MTTYTLMIDRNDETMSWGFIPDGLWKKIINGFAPKYVNEIGFAGVTTREGLTKITEFEKTRPDIKYTCVIESTFQNKLGKSTKSSREMAVFPYDTQVKTVIEQAQFNEWQVTGGEYPVDHLFFFWDKTLIFEAIPYESMITFYITDAQLNDLTELDPIMIGNLFRQDNITLFVKEI